MKRSFFSILVFLFLFSGCGDKEDKKNQKEDKQTQKNVEPTRRQSTSLSLEDRYWQKICVAFFEARNCIASHSTTTNSTQGVLNCILELNAQLEEKIQHELQQKHKNLEVLNKITNKFKETNIGQSPSECVKDGNIKLTTHEINGPCDVTGTCKTEAERENYAEIYSCMFSAEGAFQEKMTTSGCVFSL